MTVVVGRPCAGKSTFVQTNAGPGDAVIDFDAIAKDLGSPNDHDHPAELLPIAEQRRQELIAECLADPSRNAWVILTYVSQAKRLGIPGSTPVVTVNPGLDVCMFRARAAGRSPQVLKAIVDWTPMGPREFRRNPR